LVAIATVTSSRIERLGQIQTLSDFIGLLIRRRLVIGAVLVFGAVMTLLYVISKPDVFESTAVIQVQSPNVADQSDGTSQNSGQSAQRLQSIQQRLTTRENMLAVIERHGLYEGLPLSDDEKVHLLRISLRFQSVASAASPAFGAPTQVSALIISAQSDTREKAARVANDFAQGILDAGVEGQTNRARETFAFYLEEETRLLAEIASIDANQAEFQTRNADALPSQREFYRDQITGLDAGIRELDQALVAAGSERAVIERKQNLRVTDQRQIQTLSAQIETTSVQRDAFGAQRDIIQAALARMPEVEQTLREFQRSLDQLQSQLDLVTRRKSEANTAQKLEDRQQGENFALLERAIEPQLPISGGRKKLAIVGSFGSLFAGIGLAFILDLVNPALRTQTQLERQLDLRPIVAIPEIPRRNQSQRRSLGPQFPTLSDLARRLPKLPPSLTALPIRQNYSSAAALSPLQTALGGFVVIMLVLTAAAMT
jgi:tyrosine-protein kinase Etk/Wzc